MLYDENIFLPTRNPAFLHQTDKRFRKKRSTGSILKGTPAYTFVFKRSAGVDSLGVDSVHMMAIANIKWDSDIVYL